MSIISAKRFIQRIGRDKDFRELLGSTPDYHAKKRIMEDEGFKFNEKAFQEAYASMLFLSNNEQQEFRIKQVGEWCKRLNLH